jgi:hypothetical protein
VEGKAKQRDTQKARGRRRNCDHLQLQQRVEQLAGRLCEFSESGGTRKPLRVSLREYDVGRGGSGGRRVFPFAGSHQSAFRLPRLAGARAARGCGLARGCPARQGWHLSRGQSGRTAGRRRAPQVLRGRTRSGQPCRGAERGFVRRLPDQGGRRHRDDRFGQGAGAADVRGRHRDQHPDHLVGASRRFHSYLDRIRSDLRPARGAGRHCASLRQSGRGCHRPDRFPSRPGPRPHRDRHCLGGFSSVARHGSARSGRGGCGLRFPRLRQKKQAA